MSSHAEAIVIGGGMSGLAAAHRFTQLGVRPLLLEARGQCGGLVFGAPIGGVRVDLGAESFARRSKATAELAEELGLEVVTPDGESWIWAHDGSTDGIGDGEQPGHAFRIPHGVLGIPTDLDDPQVADALSEEGLARAREDLTLGPDAGADAADLATLVTTRLGAEVLDRLVDPVAGGVHSVHPSQLAVDIVAPGLREALAEEGSLVGAAAALRAKAPEGSVVASVSGGLFRLAEALVSAIDAGGGTVRTRRLVTGIARDGSGWLVTHHEAGRAPNPADPPVPIGEPEQDWAPKLVIALDGRAALDLLRSLPELNIGDWELPRGADLTQVCVAVTRPELDAAPRGSGLLVTPVHEGDTPRVTCKALTHYSVKWPTTVAGTGRHVLRVSYGRAGTPTPEPTLADALADASVLLGVDLAETDVAGHAVIHYPNSLPPHTPEHRDRVAELTQAAAELEGFEITGAWYAGTGLAAVVPHGRAVAEKLSVGASTLGSHDDDDDGTESGAKGGSGQ
ncbi:protoporphyrinogen/coproporphyrinogen oxidase [Propioniciclava soli]|uniref:protoporphyrinogen/coproporphyrinogen oxidase n=1 Tax=Propioniciclava soli TaxID=2775081 RepID=UPI001E6433CD